MAELSFVKHWKTVEIELVEFILHPGLDVGQVVLLPDAQYLG